MASTWSNWSATRRSERIPTFGEPVRMQTSASSPAPLSSSNRLTEAKIAFVSESSGSTVAEPDAASTTAARPTTGPATEALRPRSSSRSIQTTRRMARVTWSTLGLTTCVHWCQPGRSYTVPAPSTPTQGGSEPYDRNRASSVLYPYTPGLPLSSSLMPELPDKKAAFIDWYLAVVDAANLTDKRYGVKGMNVWTPYGFLARRHLDEVLVREIEVTGSSPVEFPALDPGERVREGEGAHQGVRRAGLLGHEGRPLRPRHPPRPAPDQRDRDVPHLRALGSFAPATCRSTSTRS